MIKAGTKRKIAVFFASFVITSCAMIFAAGTVVAENNTAKTADCASSCPFALKIAEGSATLVVNDREYSVSTERVTQLLTSRGAAFFTSLWLLL